MTNQFLMLLDILWSACSCLVIFFIKFRNNCGLSTSINANTRINVCYIWRFIIVSIWHCRSNQIQSPCNLTASIIPDKQSIQIVSLNHYRSIINPIWQPQSFHILSILPDKQSLQIIVVIWQPQSSQINNQSKLKASFFPDPQSMSFDCLSTSIQAISKN